MDVLTMLPLFFIFVFVIVAFSFMGGRRNIVTLLPMLVAVGVGIVMLPSVLDVVNAGMNVSSNDERFVKLNISTIPNGTTIDEATLILYDKVKVNETEETDIYSTNFLSETW